MRRSRRRCRPDHGPPRRRRRPVLPVHPQRGLEPGGRHRQVAAASASTRAWACARVAGEKTAFAYSDDISEAALLDAAAHRARHRRGRPERPREGARPSRRLRQPRAVRDAGPDRQPATAPRRWRCWRAVENLARAKDPRVAQVMAGLAGEYDVVLVARADGTLAADVRPLVRLSRHGDRRAATGRREVGSGGGGGRFGLGLLHRRADRELRRTKR